MKSVFLATLLTTSALPLASQASAQTTAPEQAAAPDNANQLEDIVVTATRRAENLQKVPLTVTALTTQGIRDSGIQNTRELQITTPGLTFTQAGGGFAQPYIHGIGTEITTPGGENSVPIFIDDVYISQSLLGVQQLAGVERVEVLKGPQGTLYGRNASGGAINIQTKNPGHDPEGDLSLSYGNYNEVKAQGYVSVPLSGKVFANFAGTYEDHTGYGKSLNTGRDINDLHYYSMRGKILFEASDNFDVMVTGHYYNKDDKDHLGYSYTSEFGTTPLAAALGGRVTFQSRDLYTAFNGLGSKVEAGGANLRANLHLGDTTITSLTSYAKMTNYIGVDYVGADIPIFNFQAQDQARTITQSLFANGQFAALTWTAGVQYLNDKSSFTPNYVYTGGPAEATTATYATIKTESIAGYAEGTYAFGDIFKLTAGVRYNHDKKTQERLDVYAGPGLGDIYHPIDGGGTLISSTPKNSRTFNSVTFKVSPQAQITKDILLYGKVETGFKSGTYNATVAFDAVKPEKITSYEVGLKSEFLDDRLRLNISGFYYNLRNLQVFYTDPATGGTLIQSAPRERIYGADVEASALIARGLTISGGATFLSAKYRDYVANSVYAPNPGGIGNATLFGVDVAGNYMQRAPKFTGNARVTYDLPLPDNMGQLRANAQYYYSGKFYGDAIERFVIHHYNILNAGLEYTFPNKHLSLEVWGRNLTNAFYFTAITIDPFGDRGSPSDPRTYGGTIRYRF
jgi:iron complex outermembrane recepter protein